MCVCVCLALGVANRRNSYADEAYYDATNQEMQDMRRRFFSETLDTLKMWETAVREGSMLRAIAASPAVGF